VFEKKTRQKMGGSLNSSVLVLDRSKNFECTIWLWWDIFGLVWSILMYFAWKDANSMQLRRVCGD